MDNFLEDRVDKAFLRALDHLLRVRDLSILRFCRLTKKISPEGRELVLPTQVTKWRRDRMPSAKAAMITAATLDVPRSYLYYLGEALGRGEQPGGKANPTGLDFVLAALDRMDEAQLRELEIAVVERQMKIAAAKARASRESLDARRRAQRDGAG